MLHRRHSTRWAGASHKLAEYYQEGVEHARARCAVQRRGGCDSLGKL